MTAKGSAAAYVQFSKRLAITITVFWCVFRVGCLAVLLFRPSLAGSMQGLMQGADDVMMCNIGFYCGNSVAEKGIIGYFGRKKASNDTEEG